MPLKKMYGIRKMKPDTEIQCNEHTQHRYSGFLFTNVCLCIPVVHPSLGADGYVVQSSY